MPKALIYIDEEEFCLPPIGSSVVIESLGGHRQNSVSENYHSVHVVERSATAIMDGYTYSYLIYKLS